ncbi:DivIVA domain-containing protein [Dactylosporangium darangshiense]|uniref:Cell division initiation protein n=1 Tax=Dactylosporangium darangshiense TaxID=579108 RepID=A0ABP8D7V5_9ACTN
MTQNVMQPYDGRLVAGPGEPQAPRADVSEQAKALQVLTMAQRTAEEHIETARREAEQIRGEAHAEARQIVGEAQAHAGQLRDEVEKLMNRARMAADKVARDAEEFAADTERHAGEVMAEAQGRAQDIVREAQANAHEIRQRAERIYEDVVGGLTAKRQALQGQIEALEGFDHEYRSRLTAFMQQQMRALWVGQPQVANEFQDSAPVAGELLPAQRGEHAAAHGAHAGHDQHDEDEDNYDRDDDERADEPQPVD